MAYHAPNGTASTAIPARVWPNLVGLNIEDIITGTDWWKRNVHFDDPSGLCRGNVTYLLTQADSTPNGTKSIVVNNGAANITFDNLNAVSPNL